MLNTWFSGCEGDLAHFAQKKAAGVEPFASSRIAGSLGPIAASSGSTPVQWIDGSKKGTRLERSLVKFDPSAPVFKTMVLINFFF